MKKITPQQAVQILQTKGSITITGKSLQPLMTYIKSVK